MRITETNAITMVFMRFAIDAVFLDRRGRVVKVRPHLRPWVPVVLAPRGFEVLELPEGAIERTGTQVGDEVTFEAP